MKTTKQGVRDLNDGKQKHVHKFIPVTYVNRTGHQTTSMKCWCGADQPTEKYEDACAFGYE